MAKDALRRVIFRVGLEGFVRNSRDIRRRRVYIRNYFGTQFNKKVLISYITYPFRHKLSMDHNTLSEALLIAKVFRDMGYNVDVVEFDSVRKIDYCLYSMIFGFGDPLEGVYKSSEPTSVRTVYYGTGMHVCHQNHSTLERLRDVHQKTGVWLLSSARIVQRTWSIQTTLVDAMVALGNDRVIDSYKKYYAGSIYRVPVTCLSPAERTDYIESKNMMLARTKFLWFGGAGAIHKGLDLLLEVFESHLEWELYICGPITAEQDFCEVYHRQLFDCYNIHTIGFVNVGSQEYTELVNECAFVVLPSCSEGEASSVINCMGSGLLPVVTETAGIRKTEYCFSILDVSSEAVEMAIVDASSRSPDWLREMSIKCALQTRVEHSPEAFMSQLSDSVRSIEVSL